MVLELKPRVLTKCSSIHLTTEFHCASSAESLVVRLPHCQSPLAGLPKTIKIIPSPLCFGEPVSAKTSACPQPFFFFPLPVFFRGNGNRSGDPVCLCAGADALQPSALRKQACNKLFRPLSHLAGPLICLRLCGFLEPESQCSYCTTMKKQDAQSPVLLVLGLIFLCVCACFVLFCFDLAKISLFLFPVF